MSETHISLDRKYILFAKSTTGMVCTAIALSTDS